VVITPAAGYVSPIAALAMGALGAVPSYYAIVARARTRLDDSLDVLAGHGVGGISGALLTGVFASAQWGGVDGLLHGRPVQLGLQAIGVLAAIVYSGGMSVILLKLVGAVIPLRVADKGQGVGLDITQHGEEAYTHGEGALLLLDRRVHPERVSATAAGRAVV
jgi:Amt family ammonium transporter